MTARSLLHHGSSTSSSDAGQGSSPSMQTPSGQLSSSFDHHRQGTASHVRFLLLNHVLYIGYVDMRRYDFAR
jgi:hypothetical protein